MRLAEPRQIEANSEHMDLLVSMGFTELGAQHALVRSDNNLEAAINLLTSMPAGWEPLPDAPGTATAHVQGTAAVQPVAEQETTSQQQGGDAGRLNGRDPDSESSADEGADVDAAANAEEGSDEASLPRMSETGSDMLSADEEQPLLSAAAGHASSGDPSAEITGMARHDARQSRGSEHPSHAGGGGDSGEHVVTDVLQAADTDHLPLDTPTMMELQEGMRGLMTALGATTAGIANDGGAGSGGSGGGPMSGAMPILATGGGSDAAGMLDPMRLVDEIRWGGAFPAMLGDLLGPDVDEGGLTFDDYRTESTVYDDDEQDEDSDEDVAETNERMDDGHDSEN